MINVCPVEGIYAHGNLSEITQEIFDAYNWTCNYEGIAILWAIILVTFLQSASHVLAYALLGCTNHTLKFALTNCEYILSSFVKPNAINSSDDVKLDKACM